MDEPRGVGTWSIYQRVSPRFAFFIGQLISTVEYGVLIENRLNENYRRGKKRRYTRAYSVRMGYPGPFVKGWN